MVACTSRLCAGGVSGIEAVGRTLPAISVHAVTLATSEERWMIPMAKPLVGEEEIQEAVKVLRSGWVSQGPCVASFEKAFAASVGAAYGCAVSSCTAALHLALIVAGVRPGDQVITVSHSFIATANSIRYCGAIPVFIDISPDTLNIDPAQIEAAIGERTRAILCAHQLGMPCDVPRIKGIASRYNLPVIEDAACATGSELRIGDSWERIGRPHGDIACFSFHPRKVITTGEGGMLTTNNGEWDSRIRQLRQHCMSVPDTVRHGASEVIFEEYRDVGFNYRMTDIQAAVGCAQLKRLPEIVEIRRKLASRYRELLSEMASLAVQAEPCWARSNWQSFCVRLPGGCDQRKVMQRMLDSGVATRRGVMCAHREAAYPSSTWKCGPDPRGHECTEGHCQRLRHSEEAQDHTLMLPFYPQMTLDEQDRVVDSLREALRVGYSGMRSYV